MDDLFWIKFSLLALGAIAIFTVLVVLFVLLLDYFIRRDQIRLDYSKTRRPNRDDKFFENVKEVRNDFERSPSDG